MTVKVRSSEGEKITNDTSPDMNSPASITEGDLLVVVWMINDDTTQTITPAAGWTEEDSHEFATMGSNGTAYYMWTKRATATDATNQGNADEYTFTGMDGVDDIIYAIFSLNDDGAGEVNYVASSLTENAETGGGTDSDALTQTITIDGTLCLCLWTARDGTDPFKIGVSTAFAPTGGANPALYEGGWTSSGFSGSEIVAGSAEWDISDSPIGAQQVTHTSLNSDVDVYSTSMLFEQTTVSTIAPLAHHHYNHNM